MADYCGKPWEQAQTAAEPASLVAEMFARVRDQGPDAITIEGFEIYMQQLVGLIKRECLEP